HLDEALGYWKSVTLLCLKADIHLNLREYEEAMESCEDALKLDPEFTRAHVLKGLIYEQQGQLVEALDSFRPAAEAGDRSAAAKVRELERKLKQGGKEHK